MSLMLRRLWIQLTADRKRFGLLCAMLAVGLLLWARVIVVSNIPRTAAAKDAHETAETVAHQARAGTSMIDRIARETVTVQLDETPRRDPFVISTDYFPKPQVDGQISQEAAKSDRKHDESDSELRMRQRYQRVQREAERLKLEAVMHGAGLAIISGKTYRLGDELPGRDDETILFEVLEVNQRSVLLKSEGHEFVLELASPK